LFDIFGPVHARLIPKFSLARWLTTDMRPRTRTRTGLFLPADIFADPR